MPKYPEHEKLAEIKALSNQLGGFIEWLLSCGYHVAEWTKDEDDEDVLVPVHKSINDWLAGYYEIDLNKINDEKEQMLEEIRALNAGREGT
jgi:hypothetical protein